MSMQTGGRSTAHGHASHQLARDLGVLTDRRPLAKAPLAWRVSNFLQNRRKTVGQVTAAAMVGKVFGFAPMLAALSGRVYRADLSRLAPEQILKLKALLQENVDVRLLPAHFGGQALEYGLLSQRLVTDTGVGFIVDAFQNLVELEIMKFHGFGTGTTNESAAQTALVTELTTEYATDNTRPTGTTTEGASANIYRTVATLSPDSGGTIAITEHGIFSQAANSGGVLLDRSKFSAVNLVASADSLQTTYDLTVSSGG